MTMAGTAMIDKTVRPKYQKDGQGHQQTGNRNQDIDVKPRRFADRDSKHGYTHAKPTYLCAA